MHAKVIVNIADSSLDWAKARPKPSPKNATTTATTMMMMVIIKTLFGAWKQQKEPNKKRFDEAVKNVCTWPSWTKRYGHLIYIYIYHHHHHDHHLDH